MKKKLITLKNGLDCIIIDAEASAMGSVQMWFRAGSALEKGWDRGIAHFLEHMFFKGTTKRPGSRLVEAIESLGGEVNAFTSFDYTCYYINAPNNHLVKVSDILLDMVSDPTFKEDELLAERDVVFEEYRRSIDSPHQYAFQRVQQSSFTASYAHPILGVEKTIRAFSKNQLEAFRQSFYNIQNAFLVVSGNIGKHRKNLIPTLESFQLPSGKKSRLPPFKLKDTATFDVHQKEVAMASLSLGIQSPGVEEPMVEAEDLAIHALGHGESSPLHKELVVESSLANSVSSSIMFMNKGGMHFIRIVFPLDNLDTVLFKLRTILERLSFNGLSEKEVKKIRNQYVASKIFDLESLESHAFTVGHGFAQTKNIHNDDEFIEKIKRANHLQVNSALRLIFQRPLHLSLQVPKACDPVRAEKALILFQQKIKKSLKKGPRPSRSYPCQTSTRDAHLKIVSLGRGLRLLYRYNGLTPSFFFQASIKGGQSDEDDFSAGHHCAISTMIVKGYRGMRYEKLKENLEERSASLSGFSGKNSYGMTLHGLSEHFQHLAVHFFGGLLCPSFDNKIFSMTKKIILRTLDQDRKNPTKICFEEVARLFFKGHPYALNPKGTRKTVQAMTAKKLLSSHLENIKKKDILLTYCGDMALDDLLLCLNGHLEKFPPKENTLFKNKKMNPIVTTSFIPLDREQTQIFTGIKTGKWDAKDSLPLKFLTTHLSGQSSALFLEVRDRLGLCYSVQPLHHSALEGGYWGIYMASGHDKVARALTAIRKIIRNVQKKGLTKKEFEIIKVMIEGQNILNIQTNEDYVHVLSPPIHHGKPLDYFYKRNDRIKNFSYTEFMDSIGKILNRKWTTVIVGRTFKRP